MCIRDRSRNDIVGADINADIDVDSDESLIDSEEMKELEKKFNMGIQSVSSNSYQINTIIKYDYLNENFNIRKRTNDENSPYGTQWVHDVQEDDYLDDTLEKRALQYDKLRAIISPEQRSDEWFAMRRKRITASDGGTILGVNHNREQKPFNFIIKKTSEPSFQSNKYCYHGKKLEEPATMIYEYRMNVIVEEFGLMKHPKYNFLGASPDGIVCRTKLDGVHKTKYVGRMLEIKCPFTRKIKMDGPIYGHICPEYYWVQVQLQLECCDLEECDFWQCEIREYRYGRDQFMRDTDPNEPFRSKTTGFEKGCLIQLIPREKRDECNSGKYDECVWSDAIFVYPPKIEMSPYQCDQWVMEELSKIAQNPKYDKYMFDKVLYWKLVKSNNVTIKRDRKWFAESLPKFRKMWDYVLFFRANSDKYKLWLDYVNSRSMRRNKDIMEVAERFTKIDDPNYSDFVDMIKNKIQIGKLKIEEKNKKKNQKKNECAFIDSEDGFDGCAFSD